MTEVTKKEEEKVNARKNMVSYDCLEYCRVMNGSQFPAVQIIAMK